MRRAPEPGHAFKILVALVIPDITAFTALKADLLDGLKVGGWDKSDGMTVSLWPSPCYWLLIYAAHADIFHHHIVVHAVLGSLSAAA